MPSIPSWAQSSADPTQVSLTIISFGKSIAGLAILLATVKGIDPATADVAWTNFVAQAATLGAAIYTAFQAAELVYGLIRKGFYAIAARPADIQPTSSARS